VVEQQDRRTLIADAALRLIGREGGRGLTHRGVDAEAGLPQGSTSYYCRRRADLLALALRRHAELDLRSLSTLGALLAQEPKSPVELASELGRGLSRWIAAQDPLQLVARFELFLACSRVSGLRPLLEEQRAAFVEVLERGLGAAGIARPRSVAQALIALIEGMLLERVRVGRKVLSATELRALTGALLGAFQDPAATRSPRPRTAAGSRSPRLHRASGRDSA
jgi:DNA-binding transcriptional regulator YbjK